MNTTIELQAKIEQSILATLSVNIQMLKDSDIDVDMFEFDCHKSLYIAMKNNCAGESIDLMGIYKSIGENGFSLLTRLQESYVSASNYETDVARLEESYKKRKSEELLKELQSGNIDFMQFCQNINKLNEAYNDSKDTKIDVMDIYDLITADSKKLEFHDFTFMQAKVGFIENTLNVISARPSVGKSAFTLNIANDLSKSEKYKCIYINMEMTEKEIYERLIGINTGLVINDFPKAKIESSGKMRARMLNCLHEIRHRNMLIVNHSMSIEGIGRMIVREKRKKENQDKHLILFIDYLGYIRSKKNTNDREKMGDIVRQLQLFTKDYNCTIFLLAQINREGAEKPTLENLKDTGELEQSGHCVMILNDTEQDPTKPEHLMEVLVAKNRSGMRGGKLQFMYNRPSQKFYEVKRL